MARLDIAIWPGSGSAVSASTPFGLYDDDTAYQVDAPKVAVFSAKKLGYPEKDVVFKPPEGKGARGVRVLTEKSNRYDYYSMEGLLQNSFLWMNSNLPLKKKRFQH